MSDDIPELERAIKAARKAWDAEKAMLEVGLLAGYFQDDTTLREAVKRRHDFYIQMSETLQARLDEVRLTQKERQSEIDRVARRIISSVFGGEQTT